jgi:hypothetical protein
MGLGTAKAITNIAGAALGAGQMIAGAVKAKKADKMLPTGPTAAEQRLLEQTKAMQRALTVNQSFAEGAQASRTGKMLANKMFASGGRNLGGISSQLQDSQAAIAAGNRKEAANLMGQAVEQARHIGNVIRDTSMLKSARKSAQAEQLKQSGGMNLGASLGLQNDIEGEGKPKSTFFSRLFKKKNKMM